MSFEKSKNNTYSIQKMDEMISDKRIRVDHPNQRMAEQWVAEYRDNLVADVLGDNPISQIIVCEQINNGIPTYWLIDGKQRSTNLVKFRRGLFKLGKKIDRPIINYVHVDNSGDEPVSTIEMFDVRGKKYSDLPVELRDRFDLYNLHVEQYLDCTDDDIDYHIRRYNRVKSMSVAQKGVLYLGVETTKVVKTLAQHSFFRDNCGKYTPTDMKNGAIDRIIIESIMAINFLPKWKKSTNDICAYLREHVSVSAFDRLEDYINRIQCILDDDVRDLFDNKKSFLFFTLFARFTRYGMDDERFAEFLSAFKSQEMTEWDLDGTTYATLCEKASKDRRVVEAKLNHLERLMCNYFNIEKKNSDDLFIADRNLTRMTETFKESDVVKETGITEEEIKKVVLRYVSNETIPDEELQSYAYNAVVTEEDIEDVDFQLDMLSSWCGDNVSGISANNLATYLRFVKYATDNELSDECVTRSLAVLNGSESYEEMVASLSNQTAA